MSSGCDFEDWKDNANVHEKDFVIRKVLQNMICVYPETKEGCRFDCCTSCKLWYVLKQEQQNSDFIGGIMQKIYAKYLDRNGYEHDTLSARSCGLVKGEKYLVTNADIGGFHSSIYLLGYIGAFNSVMFEYFDENSNPIDLLATGYNQFASKYKKNQKEIRNDRSNY